MVKHQIISFGLINDTTIYYMYNNAPSQILVAITAGLEESRNILSWPNLARIPALLVHTTERADIQISELNEG